MAADVAVTGGTGAIGGRVARRLARLGAPPRLIVRDAGRAPRIIGADIREATYVDGAAMRSALHGVDTVFLVSATESSISPSPRRAPRRRSPSRVTTRRPRRTSR